MSGVKPNLATTLTSEHGGEFGGGKKSSEKLTKSGLFFIFFILKPVGLRFLLASL